MSFLSRRERERLDEGDAAGPCPEATIPETTAIQERNK
jgi:hypothetical protein